MLRTEQIQNSVKQCYQLTATQTHQLTSCKNQSAMSIAAANTLQLGSSQQHYISASAA